MIHPGLSPSNVTSERAAPGFFSPENTSGETRRSRGGGSAPTPSGIHMRPVQTARATTKWLGSHLG